MIVQSNMDVVQSCMRSGKDAGMNAKDCTTTFDNDDQASLSKGKGASEAGNASRLEVATKQEGNHEFSKNITITVWCYVHGYM